MYIVPERNNQPMIYNSDELEYKKNTNCISKIYSFVTTFIPWTNKNSVVTPIITPITTNYIPNITCIKSVSSLSNLSNLSNKTKISISIEKTVR